MAANGLLQWCKHHTSGYRDVNVTNFDRSWRNGLAFCALCHAFFPNDINFDSLKKEEMEKNLELAFSVAEKHGVPRLLDVEDVAPFEQPDRFSIITYLGVVHQHFELKGQSPADFNKQQEQKKKEQESKKQNSNITPYKSSDKPPPRPTPKTVNKPVASTANASSAIAQKALENAQKQQQAKNAQKTQTQTKPTSTTTQNYQINKTNVNNQTSKTTSSTTTQNNQNKQTNQTKTVSSAKPVTKPNYCAKCGQVLSGGNIIEAIGKRYHQKCFGCTMCGRTLGADFVNLENKPYCNVCARKVWVQKNAQKQQNASGSSSGANANTTERNFEEEKKKLLEKQQKEKEELMRKHKEEKERR